MPHGVERQNLQRPGSENAGVINEEAQATAALGIGHAGGPRSHSLLFGDVADCEADALAGGLFQIPDLPGVERRTENGVTLGGKPEGDIASKTAAGAGNDSGAT